MREVIIEQASVDLAEQTGWAQWKMQFIGIRGCPDRWFMKAGRLLIVEFKKPGGDLDGHQVRRIRELRCAGFKVHVIDDYDDFARLLARAEQDIAKGGFLTCV